MNRKITMPKCPYCKKEKEYRVGDCGYCHQGGDEVEEVFNIAIKPLERKSETVIEFTDQCQECGAKYGKLLKQYKAFAEWVALEIFDENWEYNKDAFAELACRKLAKLGIVKEKGDEWELVELQAEKEEVE